MGRGARAHSSPAPRLPTPSPPTASPPPAHCPKEPPPAVNGDIGHIGAQRRQGAGLPLRPHNPPPHASPSLRGVRGLVGLAGGTAPRPALMRLQMLLHLKPLFVQPFTNVVASVTI